MLIAAKEQNHFVRIKCIAENEIFEWQSGKGVGFFSLPSDPSSPELGPSGVTILHGGNLPHPINLKNNRMGVHGLATWTNLPTSCVASFYAIKEAARGFLESKLSPVRLETIIMASSLPFKTNNLIWAWFVYILLSTMEKVETIEV